MTRVTYPLAIANVQVWSAYCVSALPATFFVSAQGRILGADFGGMARSSLLHLVRQLFHVNPP